MNRPDKRVPSPPITQRGLTVAPLSLQQTLAWNVPDHAAYSPPPMALQIEGTLRLDCLQAAVNQVVARHETLRTTFGLRNDVPQQTIHPSIPVDVSHEDLSGASPAEQAEVARERLREETLRPFDLANGPLLRCGVMTLAPEKQLLVFGIHHIVNDFWSMKLFLRELVTCYSAAAGGGLEMKPLPVQYADFTMWQRDWLESVSFQGELAYWRQHLQGMSTLPLGVLRKRAFQSKTTGRVISRTLSADLSHAVRRFGRDEGVTLFMTLLSALLLVLWRSSGSEDLSVSTLLAVRTRHELEHLIGFLSHSVVLRISLAGNPSLRETLRRVRDACIGAYEHPHLPFWKLAELSPGENWAQYTAPISFALQKSPEETSSFPGLRCTPFESTGVAMFEGHQSIRTHWPQTWQVWEHGNQLQFVVIYSDAMFDTATIEKMMADMEVILQFMTRDSMQSITKIVSYLDAASG